MNIFHMVILRHLTFYLPLLFSVTLSKDQGDKSCGILYNGDNFTGDSFAIRDGSNFFNSEDFHLPSDKLWNTTKSFQLEPGCLLTACNESYFDGTCREFTENSTSMPEGFESLQSVSCTCAAACLCTDVHLRKPSCARGYISKGCNTCNAFYTDFKGEKEFLPGDINGKITSIIVRKGCTLTVYDEEDFEGNSVELDGVKEVWTTPFHSYECVCDEYKAEMIPERKQRPLEYPPFIDIPENVDNVRAILDTELGNLPKYGKHPGLIAALKSNKGKRSTKNAYILLLGLTGSGKSSTINLLFGNPNITTVGSCTNPAIEELRIPVPIDHLGIRNSELRIIDTPGLGDTRGLEKDAKFLATLEDFLNGHEELSNRIPNIVLVFAKFHDNRFMLDGSAFVKMLRSVESFRDRITDKRFSNVIFVFSHYMSETRAVTRFPGSKLKNFKKVIEDYSSFPKPVSIVFAENKAEDNELTLLNGYYKLPNGDFYPRNLFEKIEAATINGVDPIGEATIRAAFSNSNEFNISKYFHPIVNSGHRNVGKYLSKLVPQFGYPENTEVSRTLAAAYETLDSDLQRRFPGALSYLQRLLNIKNIRNNADLPRTTEDILKLFKDIKKNDAIFYLMEKGFGLKAPTLKENVITGHGYNLMEDRPLTTSPFKLGEPRYTDIGFMIPSGITCNVEWSSSKILKVFQNREQYLKSRLQGLNVEALGIPLENFKGELQPGSNIIEKSPDPGTRTVISAVKEYKTFELVLNPRLELAPEFVIDVKNLTAYNSSDYYSIDSWKKFFNIYGTHVVKSTHGGGSVEIKLTKHGKFGPGIAQSLLNIIEFEQDFSIGRRGNASLDFNVDGTEFQIKFKGGDRKYHNVTDLKSMSLTEAADFLENWEESLILNPSMPIAETSLLPISEVAQQIGLNYSAEIQIAAMALFNSTFKCLPPPTDMFSLKDREQTGNDYNTNEQNHCFAFLLKEIIGHARRADEKLKVVVLVQENVNKQFMTLREKELQETLQFQQEHGNEGRELEQVQWEESDAKQRTDLKGQTKEYDLLFQELQNYTIQIAELRADAEKVQQELQQRLFHVSRSGRNVWGSCLDLYGSGGDAPTLPFL